MGKRFHFQYKFVLSVALKATDAKIYFQRGFDLRMLMPIVDRYDLEWRTILTGAGAYWWPAAAFRPERTFDVWTRLSGP